MFIPVFAIVAAKLSLLKAIGLKSMFLKPMVVHPLLHPNPGAIHPGFFYHHLVVGGFLPASHINFALTHNDVIISLLTARA